MAKGKSLVNEVLGLVRHSRPGFRTWFERLPQDAREELEAVRAAFDPTTHQKRAYAHAIIAVSRERGWNVAGEKQVIAWLNARD